jgi:hypothetical protein
MSSSSRQIGTIQIQMIEYVARPTPRARLFFLSPRATIKKLAPDTNNYVVCAKGDTVVGHLVFLVSEYLVDSSKHTKDIIFSVGTSLIRLSLVMSDIHSNFVWKINIWERRVRSRSAKKPF